MVHIINKRVQNKGFTLVELLATLVLMSFIGLGASYFFVYAVQGFMLSKANNEVFQKTNIAMERLIREFKHMDEIYSAGSDSILFERDGTRLGIALVDNSIRLVRANTIPNASSNPGFILIDNIKTFSMTFENPDGTAWSIPADNSITGLSKITITLQTAIRDASRTFRVEVNPLYNNMVNGPTS